METKRILIEDEKGTKYYPVTNIDNIVDINNVNKYINIDNISLNNVKEENLGDTIINIKNELKDHKHLANQITETDDKKFVTKEQLEDINQIKNKADQKEVDSLKQSGIEINKILVDALNSKKVIASTSNSIKTNVEKVKNIKIGDYKKSDVLTLDKITPIYLNYNVGEDIKRIAIDSDDYLYVLTSENKMLKISTMGFKYWSYQIDFIAKHFDIDKDNNTYVVGSDTLIKISPNGKKLWEKKLERETNVIAVNKENDLYIGSSQIIYKYSNSGNKIWETSVKGSVGSLAIGPNNEVYGGAWAGLFEDWAYKITSSGKEVWRSKTSGGVIESLTVDEEGNAYVGTRSNIIKLEYKYGNEKWEKEIKVWEDTFEMYKGEGCIFGAKEEFYFVSKTGVVLESRNFQSRIHSLTLGKNNEIYLALENQSIISYDPIRYKLK